MSSYDLTNMWNSKMGMFDGQELPMMTGFSLNVANFSQRPSIDITQEFTQPNPTPSTTTQPAPVGTDFQQEGMMPSASFPSAHTQPTMPTPANGQPPSAFAPPATIRHVHHHSTPSIRTHNHPPSHQAPTNVLFTLLPVPASTTNHAPVYHHPNSNFHSTNTNNNVHNVPSASTSSHGHLNVSVLTPPPAVYSPTASTPFGPHLASGNTFRAAACPQAHASYDNDRVIVSRANHGSTPKEIAKICELCTAASNLKISKGKIAQLLTTSGTDYDIVEDAARWQTSLANSWRHIVQYDYMLIALIPVTFDPNDVTSLLLTTELVNCILDHDKLTNHHYFTWQSFLHWFALAEE